MKHTTTSSSMDDSPLLWPPPFLVLALLKDDLSFGFGRGWEVELVFLRRLWRVEDDVLEAPPYQQTTTTKP